MSISAPVHDSSASLIERLRQHLKMEAYAPSIQRSYPTLARHFLNYCDGKSLSMDAVRSVHVAQFLRREYRLFCQRHGQSLPLGKWSHRYTGAVHVLLRLVHGRWPIVEPPATELEAFHRNVVQDYDRWLADLRGLCPETRTKRTTYALRFLTSLGSKADRNGLADLSVRDVDAHLKHRCRGLRRASIEDCTVCLRDFLRHLCRNGLTATDLSVTVIGPRIYEHEGIPSALRAEEVQRVLEVTREDLSPAGLRDYAVSAPI